MVKVNDLKRVQDRISNLLRGLQRMEDRELKAAVGRLPLLEAEALSQLLAASAGREAAGLSVDFSWLRTRPQREQEVYEKIMKEAGWE